MYFDLIVDYWKVLLKCYYRITTYFHLKVFIIEIMLALQKYFSGFKFLIEFQKKSYFLIVLNLKMELSRCLVYLLAIRVLMIPFPFQKYLHYYFQIQLFSLNL